MARDDVEPVDRFRRQQEALADFGLYAFRSTDLNAILHRASELAAEALGVKFAKVLELLPGGSELLIRAGVNWNPGVVGHVTFGANGDSPAGYALCHDEPVVSPDLQSESRFQIPQVLVDHNVNSMVNVVIAGDHGPFGVLEVDSEQSRDFEEEDIAFLRSYANLLAAAVDRHGAHVALERAASERQVLIEELVHRVRNILALVQALANRTAAEHSAARSFRDMFVGRLQALATAESLILGDGAPAVDLRSLVQRSLEPFLSSGNDALTFDGPSVGLPARSARMLGLVLHELAANATKHGGLSVPEGRIQISWALGSAAHGQQVRFAWIESGHSEIQLPKREGFGTIEDCRGRAERPRIARACCGRSTLPSRVPRRRDVTVWT